METRPHVLTTTVTIATDRDAECSYVLRCPEGCDFYAWEECERCRQADGPTDEEAGEGVAHGVEHRPTEVGWSVRTDYCFATQHEELRSLLCDSAADHPELNEPGEHLVSVSDEGDGYLYFAPWKDED